MSIEESGKTPFGQRLAEARRRAGFGNAQALADAILEKYGEDEARVTRATIANLETGRKRDVGALEVTQIAATIGTSPLFLLLDMEKPFSSVDWLPLPGSTNLEAFDWFTGDDPELLSNRSIPESVKAVLELKNELELALREVNRISNQYAEHVARAHRSPHTVVKIKTLEADYRNEIRFVIDTIARLRSELEEISGGIVPAAYDTPTAPELWSKVLEIGEYRHSKAWEHN